MHGYLRLLRYQQMLIRTSSMATIMCLLWQVQALQQQHKVGMANLRHSQGAELRRALRNQEVELIIQHLKEKQGLVDQSVLITRDEAVAELQQLKRAHQQLLAYVST